MRVLLIYPAPPASEYPRGPFRSLWVPTGLGYLGSALAADGHDVRMHLVTQIIDEVGNDRSKTDAVLRQLLEDYRPELVGLSVTTPSMPELHPICEMVHEVCGDRAIVIAGGPHPTALPEQTLAEVPGLDAIVVGEGEETIVEIADRGLQADVNALVYRDGDGLVRTPDRPHCMDLDSLIPIDYDMFDMSYFTQRSRWLIRWLPLRATNLRISRGCSNRCRFCGGHLVGGLGVRHHSVEWAVDRMEMVADRFGIEAIHFEDDTIGGSRDQLLALCDAIQRRGLHKRLKWDGCLRVDQADRDVLDALRRAGCIQVEYGFESGSDKSLEHLGKGTSVELNEQVARLTHEAGLRVQANIMLGAPGETAADIRKTVRFLRRIRPHVATGSLLAPLPGTAIYNALPDEVRQSLDWGSFTFAHWPGQGINLTAMSDRTFARMVRRFFKYVSQPWVTRQLLRDTPEDDTAWRESLIRDRNRFARRRPLAAWRLPN